MTPEALRGERIAEATRRYAADKRSVLEHLMDLCETNWTPPEVDPDEKAARLYASQIPSSPEVYKLMIRAYLAGCTRGREGAKGLVEAAETLVGILENAWPALVGLAPVERLRAALASAKRGG